jgi:hypothetical protein
MVLAALGIAAPDLLLFSQPGAAIVTNRALASEPPARSRSLTPVPIRDVVIEDEFWSPRIKVWRSVTINDCLDKFEKDRGGAINNFDWVRDGKRGQHAGPEWYDGLIYEMIRAGADFLAASPDRELEKRLARPKPGPTWAKGRPQKRGPRVRSISYCFFGASAFSSSISVSTSLSVSLGMAFLITFL